jgi:ABC-2 type transport system permease protein
VLPTPFILGLFAKQLLYLIVVILLVAVIFTIGILVFPLIGLPVLNLPSNFWALILVTLSCGICAISYALCVGVFANTQEQASGYGAVSVVILAALGGVFVPAFAMPDSFRLIMKLSPFYWGLETYYGVFLETMNIKEIVLNILPLLAATALLQAISYVGLKRKNLL